MRKQIQIDDAVFARMHKALGGHWTRRMTARFGVEAVNFSKERFRKKDWHDSVHLAWKPRKRTDKGSLMVKSGRLKRSIRKITQGDAYVLIGTDVPYAEIHNEGGTTNKSVYVRAHSRKRSARQNKSGGAINVKSHVRKMRLKVPQRQFMGKSRALEIRLQYRLKKDVEQQLGKLLKR